MIGSATSKTNIFSHRKVRFRRQVLSASSLRFELRASLGEGCTLEKRIGFALVFRRTMRPGSFVVDVLPGVTSFGI